MVWTYFGVFGSLSAMFSPNRLKQNQAHVIKQNVFFLLVFNGNSLHCDWYPEEIWRSNWILNLKQNWPIILRQVFNHFFTLFIYLWLQYSSWLFYSQYFGWYNLQPCTSVWHCDKGISKKVGKETKMTWRDNGKFRGKGKARHMVTEKYRSLYNQNFYLPLD